VKLAHEITFIGALVSLLLMLGAGRAHAQDEQEKKEAAQKDIEVKNETEQKEAPLPKISLPEFVITGNERIELKIKPKQEKDEERIFIPDNPTPGSRSMEIEGVLSPKQIKQFAKAPSGLNGKLFAGFGFYQTPQFDGWFGQYDQTNSFILNGYYSSSEGFIKNAGGWKGGAGASAKYVMPESSFVLPFMQLNGDFRYGRESYFAYGSAKPTQARDISVFDISLGAGSRYALPYKSLSGFDYTGSMGLRSFSLSDSTSSSETEFSLNGAATARFLSAALRGQIEYRNTGYTMGIPFLHSGQWFALKGEGQGLLFTSLQVTLSLQQFFYRGNIRKASGRLYPQVEFRYFLTESATMTAGFAPSVERNTLESLSKQNKYIYNSLTLEPSDIPVHAFAGMEVTPVEELTVSAKFSYKQVSNYPTFLDTIGAKVWKVEYLPDVSSTKVDGSFVYRLNPSQNVTAYFSARKVRQKNSSSVVPYIPAYSLGAAYHHFFDFGLHLQGLVEYVAPRYINLANTDKNAAYLITGVKGEMELFEKFHGVAEIQNALNRRYYIWDGYQERTIYLLLGITYNW